MGESARYHLRYPSRCLASVLADKENNRFLVIAHPLRCGCPRLPDSMVQTLAVGIHM
jgi:hypothetical protein